MKRLFLLIPVILLSVWIFNSCEVIDAPYFEPEYLESLPADEKCVLAAADVPAFTGNEQTFPKKVLLEEMTGHQCGNCPEATKEAVKLKDEHGDKLVFLSIHAGPLANVKASGDKYTSDYNTDEGTEWYNTLNDRNAVPFGMVDRVEAGTNGNEWSNYVDSRLAETSYAGIRVFTCFDADSSELGIVIDLKFTRNFSKSERLSVVMVEDQIVDWQKNYRSTTGSPDIPDYIHHDILRATVNGTWGEPISNEDIAANSTFTKSFSFEVPEGWNAGNCKVIAFVHDFDTKEVHQVESASLQ